MPVLTLAQVSTATIQGTVTDASGVLPGASITARDIQSGFTHEATSTIDGSFTLAGLRPGRNEITVAVAQYKPEAKTVEVRVRQAVTLNFRISPDVVVTESVTVVGDTRLVDTRTSEVTTNVTQEQLRYLPQNSRNFLNFAALAPGVRVSDNEFRKEFGRRPALAERQRVHRRRQLQERRHRRRRHRPGLQPRQPVSTKCGAGVPGADPELQGRIREGRERDHHRRHQERREPLYSGELFSYYQDKALVENEAIVRDANNIFVKGETTPKPAYERWQWGLALGGPIVRDRMQFFALYEENRRIAPATCSSAPS